MKKNLSKPLDGPSVRKQHSLVRRKISLVVVSVCFSLLLLELLLRIGGAAYLIFQRKDNYRLQQDQTFRILTIGESTTAGLDDSWPKQLENILNQRNPHIHYKVFNEGIMGTNTAFIAARLEHNIEKYHPDLVISMMGINDELQGMSFQYTPTLKTKFILFFNDIRLVKVASSALRAVRPEVRSVPEETDSLKRGQVATQWGGDDPVSTLVKNGNVTLALDTLKREAEQNPEDHRLQLKLGQLALKAGEIDYSRKVLSETARFPSVRADALYLLSLSYYYEDKNTKIAIYFANQAISSLSETSEFAEWMHISLGEMYISEKKYESAIDVLHTAVTQFPGTDYSVNLLANATKLSNKKVANSVVGKDFDMVKLSQIDITRSHYSYVRDLLKESNIKYVAMQYPTRKVDDLKQYIEDTEGVTFVSNEDFLQLVQEGGYDKFFVDRFASTFGHTTPLGSRKIAEHVATVIESKVEVESD